MLQSLLWKPRSVQESKSGPRHRWQAKRLGSLSPNLLSPGFLTFGQIQKNNIQKKVSWFNRQQLAWTWKIICSCLLSSAVQSPQSSRCQHPLSQVAACRSSGRGRGWRWKSSCPSGTATCSPAARRKCKEIIPKTGGKVHLGEAIESEVVA